MKYSKAVVAAEKKKFEVVSNLKPEFKGALVTQQSLDLSKGVLKESKVLGQIYDYEGDPFTAVSESKDGLEFLKARLNDAFEWILEIDYDAIRNKELKLKNY